MKCSLQISSRQYSRPSCSRAAEGESLQLSLSQAYRKVLRRNTAVLSAKNVQEILQKGKNQVLLLDNYDSFTYNLSQYLGQLNCKHVVLCNDDITIDDVKAMQPRAVLVSPGPGNPDESGISLELVSAMAGQVPVFGVCMGHQCIGQSFGGSIIRAPHGVMHGKTSNVQHTGVGVLEGLQSPLSVCRYHSLVIDSDTCPDELEVTAWTDDGVIMAVRHKKFPDVQGVQFHPESIITDNGLQIIRNFVESLAT